MIERQKEGEKTDLVFPFREQADSLAWFVVCFRLKYRPEREKARE